MLAFIGLCLFGFVVFYLIHLFKFTIPPGMTLYIGAPGSGKTTIAARCVRDFYKHKKRYKGMSIFSNVPLMNATRINPNEDMGKFMIENGIIIIDEGGIEFNNRKYKSLSSDIIQFAKLYRHYGLVSFLFFSQGLDIDITFVRLCDRIILVSKSILPYFIKIRSVKKVIGIDDLSKQLVDQYAFKPFSTHLIFAPLSWKLFDTYETPYLPHKDFPIWNNKSRFNEKIMGEGSAVLPKAKGLTHKRPPGGQDTTEPNTR